MKTAILKSIENQIIVYGAIDHLINFQNAILNALKPLDINDADYEIKQVLNWNKVLKNVNETIPIHIWSAQGIDQALSIDQNWESLSFRFVSFDKSLDLTTLQAIIKQFNLRYLWIHHWEDQYNLKTDLMDVRLTTTYVDQHQDLNQSHFYLNRSSADNSFDRLKANHQLQILNQLQVQDNHLTKSKAKTL